MSHYDNFLELVKEGQEGNYPWIPIGQPKMSQHIGIGKRLYHLVGGDPGTGKTSFVDQNYVLRPYHWHKEKQPEDDDTKFRVLYFSMERSKEYKLAKWVAMRLWEKDNILIDVPTILGWGTAKRELTDREKSLISQYQEYFEEMLNYVHIIDGADNPTGVYRQLMDWALKNGELLRRDEHGNLYRKDREKFLDREEDWEKVGESAIPEGEQVPRYDTEYFPDDPHLITQFIIDHLGKVKLERTFNRKQTLDKQSEYNTIFRDLFGFCSVNINQFNRNNSNMQRRVNTDMSPEKQDFKGSGNMYEDADVVMGLFNPHEFGIKTHLGYKVRKMINEDGHNRFRSISVLKNTYGIDNIAFGCQFIGECGYYRELPKASQMTDNRYDEVAYPNGIVN